MPRNCLRMGPRDWMLPSSYTELCLIASGFGTMANRLFIRNGHYGRIITQIGIVLSVSDRGIALDCGIGTDRYYYRSIIIGTDDGTVKKRALGSCV